MGAQTNVLTPRRRAILRAMRENGRLQTWRELARAVELASSDTVHYHLCVLRRQGYVEWEPHVKRTLRLTDKGLWASHGFKLLWTADADGIHKEK